jgi:hypothetical protein
MSLISDWLIYYKLSLHFGKKEFILFGLNFNLNRVLNCLQVTCNGTDIKYTSFVKYLGAKLDQMF